ncbi:ATPase central domain-containing protein [Streptomyces davaonensis JCM 4913]|uniref:ATPase central domain-containing protein n=1 Tax=Streptomyces davaonensis (strain DSM 101723 / JCM 4913 / KCC S-0913 / 768) TaxID=1214101 RepID=K4QXK9_STRDJ|nr:MoxR family ATPase [Streptomyces davaonensis]CCK25114.1 ATPase central domain-containing protein [Streptomyces davaonensis JCM 4913]
MTDWRIFRGTNTPHDGITRLPPPQAWRAFDGGPLITAETIEWSPVDLVRAMFYQAAPEILDLVNAALYLRRPLLVSGKPGVGKSSLALAIAHELGLGPVLRWPITSRTTLKDGLYTYDAIRRLHDVSTAKQQEDAETDIGRYITLGPLGTALLPRERPRVLLIDEIDKSDIDLPNDLLNVFEEGEFTIPELERAARGEQADVSVSTADRSSEGVVVHSGRVRCRAFPFVVLTSNQEREFPPAFLRRCVHLQIPPPDHDELMRIVEARLDPEISAEAAALVTTFLRRRDASDLATDHLLNALYLTFHAARGGGDREQLAQQLLGHLPPTGP